MTNDEKKSNKKPQKFDLEERTAKFAEDIIEFCKKLPKDPKFLPIIIQLIKAGTSVGANYGEADDAESKKDFLHKIGICKKESRESKYWLRIMTKTFSEFADEALKLWQEAQELNLIFASIIRRS